MPRKKKFEFREQVYDIGDDATVTVRYRVGARPKMVHNDTQVIVGHAAEQIATAHVERHGTGTIPHEGATNGPDHDTPDILALKARLGGDPLAGGLRRVPRETRPMTSEDAFREAGLELELGELSGEGLEALADAAKAAGVA